MSIFSTISKIVTKRSPPVSVAKSWKAGMWVMHQDKIAVIANVNSLTEIHYTDKITGENIGVANVPVDSLRQARYSEIPVNRRGISAEAALELGYGA